MAARSKKPGKKRGFRWLRLLFFLFVITTLAVGGAAAGFLYGTVTELQKTHALEELVPKPPETSFILTADGSQIVDEIHGEQNRILVDYEDLPENLINAFIAIEDQRFYQHFGIDPIGILRALYIDLTGKGFQGASTITQQLARNAFLTLEQTWDRKIKEAVLAIQLERQYTKEEIMEMYLNQIYLGTGYGVEVAAQSYFGKSVKDLTLAESAMIAGMTKNPAAYSPRQHPEAARKRRDIVLEKMLQQGYIDQDQYEQAIDEPFNLAEPKTIEDRQAPHFVDYVIDRLLTEYGVPADKLFNGGLRVYTTIDLDLQRAAEAAVSEILDPVYPIEEGKSVPEAAVVILDPHTGYIKAMIGGRTSGPQRGLNRAVQTTRQPGSSFKPLVVYAPAIDLGYTPATVIDDYPVTYTVNNQDWTPENWDKKYDGLIPMREALRKSANVVAVKLLDTIGIETGLEYAKKFGISTLVESGPRNDHTLSMALGGLTKGVTLLEMTSAFGTFANGGIRVEPVAVLKVTDKEGNVLLEPKPEKDLVISEQVAYVMTDMLREVVERGTGTGARIDRPAAGKTGTTSNYVDAWFVGYTPDLAGGVWMGYSDEQKEMRNPRTGGPVYGSTFAAPIWGRIMQYAHKDLPPSEFVAPDKIVTQTVCTKSGQLPGDLCPPEDLKTEIFIKGTEPRETCTVHQLAVVCGDNPQYLASDYCPNPIEKTFIKRATPWVPYKDRVPADAEQEMPTEVCTMHDPTGFPGWFGNDNEDQPAAKTFNIKITSQGIDPARILAVSGDRLVISLESEDKDFTVSFPHIGLEEEVNAGETQIIEFMAPERGLYEFSVQVGRRTFDGVLVITR